ncbi:putative zinc-binding dehydrogenase [Escherichia coli]|uniref:Putative zinc-binding dehydrogenase n=1 Tax=Escherichia coli TaxID=562 RepID=A0A376VE57_ECOLX|nr:putative zinc-binding dehydrogenase [Escherichia coli]
MLAAYLPGNSTVDLREVAVPTPGINQVLIKMKSSGICGSDVHYIYHQHRATAAAPDKPLYQGFINGHEPCGQIVAMGQGCRHFKRATVCWCIIFLAVVFARTAVVVFLSLVLAKEKRLTAGSVTRPC